MAELEPEKHEDAGGQIVLMISSDANIGHPQPEIALAATAAESPEQLPQPHAAMSDDDVNADSANTHLAADTELAVDKLMEQLTEGPLL